MFIKLVYLQGLVISFALAAEMTRSSPVRWVHIDGICQADNVDEINEVLEIGLNPLHTFKIVGIAVVHNAMNVAKTVLSNPHCNNSINLAYALRMSIQHSREEMGLLALSHPKFARIDACHFTDLSNCASPNLIRNVVKLVPDDMIKTHQLELWKKAPALENIEISAPVLLEDPRITIESKSFVQELFKNEKYSLLLHLTQLEDPMKCSFVYDLGHLNADRLFECRQYALMKACVVHNPLSLVFRLSEFYLVALKQNLTPDVEEFLVWCEAHPKYNLDWKLFFYVIQFPYLAFLDLLNSCSNLSGSLNYKLLKPMDAVYPEAMTLFDHPEFNVEYSLFLFCNDCILNRDHRLPFLEKPHSLLPTFTEIDKSIRSAASFDSLWSVLASNLTMFKRLDAYYNAAKNGQLHPSEAMLIFELYKRRISYGHLYQFPYEPANLMMLDAIVHQRAQVFQWFYLVKDHPNRYALCLILEDRLQKLIDDEVFNRVFMKK